MNNIYDILELCLNEIENGAEVEATLAKYPEHAAELRPILDVTRAAKQMAVPAPSDEVVRRNRAKLLQHAPQRRELVQVSKRGFASFQGRWVAAFALFALAMFSTLNVLHASALALPGDGLYPVKRWWEQVRLSLTIGEEARELRRTEIEDERLREIHELFALRVSTRVDFAGVVTSQRGDAWQVAGITVFVTNQTQLPDEPVQVGVAVRVYGVTRADFVVADRIEYLPVNSALPGIVPIFEAEEPTATPKPINTRTAPGSATETPIPTFTPSPTPTPTIVVPNSNSDNANSNSGADISPNRNSNDNGNNNDDDDDNANDD